MQQQDISLIEFQTRFATEEACIEHLFSLRWPDGYVCPRCGHRKYSFHSTRRLYQCSSCKYQVSVTAGTVFHKTRTPLKSWFWMIFLMARQKSGASMMSLQRMLGIRSYKTAWTMGHKIRKAMADRDAHYTLGGLVEMDDAFFGPKKPGKRGRGAEGKAKVVVAVENRNERPGFAALRQVQKADAGELLAIARDKIRQHSTVRTDGWRAYGILGENGLEHTKVIVSKDTDALRELRWVHILIGNAKGNIRGVHHGVSSKHLNRYLSEFAYRFNRRFWEPQLFNRTVAACAATSTVTFAELRA